MTHSRQSDALRAAQLYYLQDLTMEAGETVTWSLAVVSGEGFVGFPGTTTLTIGVRAL